MGDLESIFNAIKWGAIVAATPVAGTIAWRMARQAYDDVYARVLRWRQDRLTLDHVKAQNALQRVREIRADERGRFPLLYGETGILRDPNNLRAFTLQAVREAYPQIEHLDGIIRSLIAAGGWPPAATAEAMLPDASGDIDLPTRVPLPGLLEGQPSWKRLVLGVTIDEYGGREVVTADLGELVHVAVGGSSGWGKSVFLRAVTYQLAKSVDPIELAMIDLEGTTLSPFARSERLLWPLADTETDAAVILRELTEELDRRKALFAQYPGVDNLQAYNARASEYLSPWVCIIDEATALLENKTIERELRTLALRARKYGLWLWMAGQDWKASSLDTAIRNQIATRVQFKAMSDTQSRVLLQRRGAEEIQVKGRALAWLPGRDLVTLQAPIIGYDDIIATVNGAGPQHEMPCDDLSEGERIRALAEEGLSQRQIALAVYGYVGGAAYRRVKQALGDTTVAESEIDESTEDWD